MGAGLRLGIIIGNILFRGAALLHRRMWAAEAVISTTFVGSSGERTERRRGPVLALHSPGASRRKITLQSCGLRYFASARAKSRSP